MAPREGPLGTPERPLESHGLRWEVPGSDMRLLGLQGAGLQVPWQGSSQEGQVSLPCLPVGTLTFRPLSFSFLFTQLQLRVQGPVCLSPPGQALNIPALSSHHFMFPVTSSLRPAGESGVGALASGCC